MPTHKLTQDEIDVRLATDALMAMLGLPAEQRMTFENALRVVVKSIVKKEYPILAVV